MLSIFARFLSDFAVRNDDFQRENSNPSQIFRSVQISESAKTRGGFLLRGGFLIIITTDTTAEESDLFNIAMFLPEGLLCGTRLNFDVRPSVRTYVRTYVRPDFWEFYAS